MTNHYTSDERKKMKHAISAYEARIAWIEMWERISRLAVLSIAGFIVVALFYAATA